MRTNFSICRVLPCTDTNVPCDVTTHRDFRPGSSVQVRTDVDSPSQCAHESISNDTKHGENKTAVREIETKSTRCRWFKNRNNRRKL